MHDEYENDFSSMKSPLIEEMQLDFKQKLFNVINSNRKKLKVIMNNNSRCEEEAWTLKWSKSFKTIIIFDWDDTLLWTTSLIPEGWNYQCWASCTVKDTLDKLEDAVFKILYESLKHGKVYIITNSTDGWVEYSTFKFIPKVSKLLDKITIISARSNYEGEFPLNSNEWKVHAFMDTIKDVDTNSVTNLIAIGDSNGEIEAKYLIWNWTKIKHFYK